MDHVHVLLLLQRTSPQEWDAAAIADDVKMAPEVVDVSLEDLAASGLVAATDGAAGRPQFSYAPSSDALRRDVEELASMYNERPVTLVRAVYDRAPEPAASFADAFTIRPGTR